MSIVIQLQRAWFITRKNLSVYYLRGPVIIFGIVIPGFLFASFSLKRPLPVEMLIPGMLSMSLFFTVSSITPGIMPWETKMRSLERLVSSPIHLWTILLGDIISSCIYGILITSIVFFISHVALYSFPLHIHMLLGTVVAAFCFSCLGELISSVPTDNPSNVMMLSTLIKFPLIFISGIFLPIQELGQLRIVSYISPLTYYTDLLRGYISGDMMMSPAFNLMMLCGFSILFYLLSYLFHKQNMPKRF